MSKSLISFVNGAISMEIHRGYDSTGCNVSETKNSKILGVLEGSLESLKPARQRCSVNARNFYGGFRYYVPGTKYSNISGVLEGCLESLATSLSKILGECKKFP